jgi:isopenicillin N synthase-like dioxygenase
MSDAVDLEESLRGARIALEEIPVIDFGPFLTGDLAARKAVAEKIGHACRNIGFFYLTNHGISEALVGRTFAEAKRFFDQPMENKLAIDIARSPCHRGYFKVGDENLDPAKQTAGGDLKEGVKIGRDRGVEHALVRAGTPLHGPTLWPAELPGWQGAMQS